MTQICRIAPHALSLFLRADDVRFLLLEASCTALQDPFRAIPAVRIERLDPYDSLYNTVEEDFDAQSENLLSVIDLVIQGERLDLLDRKWIHNWGILRIEVATQVDLRRALAWLEGDGRRCLMTAIYMVDRFMPSWSVDEEPFLAAALRLRDSGKLVWFCLQPDRIGTRALALIARR